MKWIMSKNLRPIWNKKRTRMPLFSAIVVSLTMLIEFCLFILILIGRCLPLDRDNNRVMTHMYRVHAYIQYISGWLFERNRAIGRY